MQKHTPRTRKAARKGASCQELREDLALMGQVALRRHVIFQARYSKEEGIEMNIENRRRRFAGVFAPGHQAQGSFRVSRAAAELALAGSTA